MSYSDTIGCRRFMVEMWNDELNQMSIDLRGYKLATLRCTAELSRIIAGGGRDGPPDHVSPAVYSDDRASIIQRNDHFITYPPFLATALQSDGK
jgi:hypothetical protein